MPISLEQWRAAVGRWVARIQQTLIIRRGVKRSPPCASNQEWESPSGQSHSGERKCMGKRKGRKKYKEDPVNDPAIASHEFCDGVIVLAVPLMSCASTVSKDCSDGNPAGSLKELFGWTALGAFLVIMLLLLRSGDVEPNPGPAERGAHTLVSISSTPTLHEQGMLAVGHVASQWEEVAPHLVVEFCGVCNINGSGHLQEASRGALSRWLKDESDTDIAEKTRCSVLEAQEANGNIQLAEQLKLFEESSEEPVTDHASSPGVFGTGRRQQYMSPTTTAAPHVRRHPPGDLGHAGPVHTPFGGNEIHSPDVKLAQQGAHNLLSISSMPTLHELGKLTVGHAASQWEEVAPHLVVESCGVCKINGFGRLQEASRGALSRWLKGESDTDIAEKTRCSVLEAQEASRNIPLAEQLKLFEESSEKTVTGLASPTDPIRPSCHLSCGLLNELPHFDLSIDCLCCLFGECMTAGPTRSDLRCPLSDEVSVSSLSPGSPAHLLLLGKRSIDFNALTRRMAALITFILRQAALVALAFLLLFLLEVTAANLHKAKAWWKGGSPSGNSDISYQYKMMRTFKSICVQCPLHLQMTVTTKCKNRAAPQQLCGLLAKPYVFLRELLLLAGDVEPNPGPVQAEEVLLFFRDRFISEVDANAIVMTLLHKGIIHEGDQKDVSIVSNPIEQNEILHLRLKKKCTNDALKTVCDVMIGVAGNPKMAALGADMQKRLETVAAGRGIPDASLTLPSSKNEKEMVLQFFKNVENYNVQIEIVQDNFCRDRTIEFVKLAMAPFKLGFENQQKRFVEAVCDPEGVDKVLTVVKGKVEYKDLSAMIKRFKLLVLSGAPGVGKSTLARKLCQELSERRKQHDYCMVLLVELRNLIAYDGSPDDFETTHLLEHFSGLMCDGCTPEMVAKALGRERGKGVLLILDGFDELSAQLRRCPYFHNLLTHSLESSLSNCDIVLTSRSIVTSEIYEHMDRSTASRHFVNVEVLGFKMADVNQFTKRYFKEQGQPELLKSFLDKLEQFPRMKSLCSNPVVLSIMCVVYLSKEDLPPTLTKVYDAFICEKLLLNSSSQDARADSVLHLPDDHDFYQLCSTAYSCIVNQQIIFTAAELKGLTKKYSNRESGCGLLTARPVGELRSAVAAVDSFYYIHLMVQEFLSAVDITRQDISIQKEIWGKYFGQSHMAQVWKFFCGLSSLKNFHALQLSSELLLTSTLREEELLVQSLYESQNSAVVNEVMQNAFGDSPDVKPRHSYSAIAYGYCLQQHKSMKELTVSCARSTRIHIGNLLTPVLQTANGLHLTLRECHPKDWIEAANSLKSVEEGEQNAADNREEATQSLTGSCEEHDDMSNLVQTSVERVSLPRIPLDFVCEALELFGHVKELECTDISDPKQSLSRNLLSKMTSLLALNNTTVRLVLHCQDLTQKEDVKVFTHHLLLGLSDNTTLTVLSLSLPKQCWDWLQEGNLVPRHVKRVTLGYVPLDLVCDVVKRFEHVEDLHCVNIQGPQQSLSLDLLSQMSTSLAQNKTMVKLKLHGYVDSPEDGKLFIRHLLLGLSGNNTLTDLTLKLPLPCWDWPDGNLVQSSVESVSLDEIPLDFVCEALKFFGHVKELKCANIRGPRQSLSRELLNKMSTSLAQNKTMVKLRLDSGVYSLEDGKPFIRHLLLGLNGNNTLTDLTLNLPPSWWDWPEGNLVQRSVERVSLDEIPLDFVCEALEFFGHVEKLECTYIGNPQKSGVAEDGLKLEELEGKLAGHESLKKLRFHFWDVPTLLQKFGVAAVRGVARNKSIAEFKLEPRVVDDILAQLTPDERRKFRVGQDRNGYPSIELCPVGDPSSGGAPPSTDLQSINEDTVMDLDRPEDPSVVRETSSPFPTEPAVGGDGEPITQGGSLSTALRYVPLDSLCWRLCNLAQAKELNCDSIIDPQQSLSLDLLNKMATLLAHNETLKRLELRSDSLTQYNDAKRFTQHLLLGAAGSTTLTEVCIGFSSWWRDCHIQSGHVAGGVQKVTMWGAPLDVLCDLLPVFEPVEQLVCLNIKDPQESNMTMAALKLNEVERVLTGCTQLTTILFECCWLQSTPELFFSLCISSLLKGAARNKNITSVQLVHSEEHQQQVEEVLTYLLTDLSVEERRRIGRGQCTLESGLVCPCIEVLPITGSGKGKRSATEGAPFLPKKGRDCSD